MQKVTSPGLPPWPPLWMDERNSRAFVKVRHPTWRSYERAFFTTELVVWSICCGIACVAWTVFSTPNVALRLFFVALALVISFPMVCLAARASLRESLARTIFPTQTTLWITEESVIFKSRLYSSPVVVWRQWHDRPVGIKFIVQEDAEANKYITDQKPERKWPRAPFNEASILDLVVITPTGFGGEVPATSGGLQRSIPVSEVSSRVAQKFSMVFSAALMLIPTEEQKPRSTTNQGVDIDAAI